MLIDRAGTFRGRPTDWAVSTTTNGFPQFVVKLLATEYFEDGVGEPGRWAAWDYGQEITAFLVLFGGDGKPCLNFEQVQKAFDWDGGSFAALDSGEWANTVVQFRVEDHEYEGKQSLQVNWIDAHDAEPGRSIKKLDAKSLKQLDAKFKGQMGQPAAAPKSAKPAAPPKAPPKTEPETEPEAPADPPAEEADTATPPAAKKKPGRPPGSKNKKPDTPSAVGGGLPSTCTMNEAWEKLTELKADSVTEDALTEAWMTASDKIVPNATSEEDITPEQWAKIRDAVFDVIEHSKF